MSAMLKMLLAASAVSVMFAGAASAQGYYVGAPAPPYSVGGYGGGGDCRFTLAGVHASVTVLGLEVGGRVGASVPTDCGVESGPAPWQAGGVAYQRPYGPPYEQPYGPPYAEPYGAAQPYGYQPYGYQRGYAGPPSYPQPVAYPAPQPYGYPAGYAQPPCGCQQVAYQPY
jgi:hypothetical protein